MSALGLFKDPPPQITSMVNRWIETFLDGREPGQAEISLLQQLERSHAEKFRSLGKLKIIHPDYFYGSISELYEQVLSDDDKLSKAAAETLSHMVSRSDWVRQAGEAEMFLRAYASVRQQGYLFRIVGRYGFDPTPYMKEYLAEHPDEGYIVLTAACMSDPIWSDTVASLVHDTMVEMAARTKPGDLHNLDMSPGARALEKMQRLDLLEDVRARVDWNAALQTPRLKAWNMTAEELQRRVLLVGAQSC
jgi:hypothetical protein